MLLGLEALGQAAMLGFPFGGHCGLLLVGGAFFVGSTFGLRDAVRLRDAVLLGLLFLRQLFGGETLLLCDAFLLRNALLFFGELLFLGDPLFFGDALLVGRALFVRKTLLQLLLGDAAAFVLGLLLLGQTLLLFFREALFLCDALVFGSLLLFGGNALFGLDGHAFGLGGAVGNKLVARDALFLGEASRLFGVLTLGLLGGQAAVLLFLGVTRFGFGARFVGCGLALVGFVARTLQHFGFFGFAALRIFLLTALRNLLFALLVLALCAARELFSQRVARVLADGRACCNHQTCARDRREQRGASERRHGGSPHGANECRMPNDVRLAGRAARTGGSSARISAT